MTIVFFGGTAVLPRQTMAITQALMNSFEEITISAANWLTMPSPKGGNMHNLGAPAAESDLISVAAHLYLTENMQCHPRNPKMCSRHSLPIYSHHPAIPEICLSHVNLSQQLNVEEVINTLLGHLHSTSPWESASPHYLITFCTRSIISTYTMIPITFFFDTFAYKTQHLDLFCSHFITRSSRDLMLV